MERKPVAGLMQTGNTTVQAITNVVAALAEFDTATGTPTSIAEGGTAVSAATAVITVPDTGVYLCRLVARITPPALTHTITLSIQKATTDIGGSAMQHVCIASTAFILAPVALVALAAGDTVRVAIVSSDAGPQNYTVDEASFIVERVA